jgi:uroporphyrinogen decarboxylase
MAAWSGLGPFTAAMGIRGFHSFLVDHLRHKAELARLLAHLADFYVGQVKAWVDCGARPHGFFMYDDLGTATAPFVRPATFAEIYEPVYRPIFDAVHAAGCDMHLHSCGKVDPLLPSLLEWGLDAVELDSPRTCGYPALQPFRGKLMFWACVNIQTMYVNGTPAECEREVWHMVRNLGTTGGGFGAYFYPQPYHILTPGANIKAFARGVKKFGTYAKIPPYWWDYPPPAEWKDNEVPPVPPGTVSQCR